MKSSFFTFLLLPFAFFLFLLLELAMSESLTRISEHLFRFSDSCNVYVLVDGDAALVIDAGSGAVLDSR